MTWYDDLGKVTAEFAEQVGYDPSKTPVARRVAELLDSWHKKREEEHPREPGLHVSMAGQCQRKTFFSLTDEPETNPISTDSHLNFFYGRVAEDALGELLSQGGELVREHTVEIPYRDTSVVGHIDHCIVFPDSKEVWEGKSIGSRQIGRLLKNFEAGRKEARDQLTLYLHASHHPDVEMPFKDYDHAHLVYAIKDPIVDQPMIFSFEVDYDPFLAERLLADLYETEQHAKRGTDPGRPLEYDQQFINKRKIPYYPCQKWCEYRDRCWADATVVKSA